MRVGVRDFSLYLRPRRKGRPVYYARFRNNDGSWTQGNSTGQTVRTLAEGWATAEVKRREAQAARTEPEPRTCTTLAAFAGADFFSYSGRWALDRRASGRRLSPRQCREKRQTFEKHVLSVLGDAELRQINRALLKDFRNGMFQAGYSSSTINRALDCVCAVLEAAEDEERIPAVPRIERASGKSAERGILSADEFGRIFRVRWIDPRAYFASALAAVAGLRMGEVLALRRSNIDSERLLVSVLRSYDSAERIMGGTTKNGKTRSVAVPQTVCRGLEMLAAVNPHGGGDPLVFWSDRTPDKPCDYKMIQRGLYLALADIGIGEAERRRRNLSFHSWRHWLNSQLIEAHVAPEKIWAVTGHSSSEMTMLYYHAQSSEMADVRAVQTRLEKESSLHTRRWEWEWISADSITEVRGADWAPSGEKIAELSRFADQGGDWNIELDLLRIGENIQVPRERLIACGRLLERYEARRDLEQKELNAQVAKGRLGAQDAYDVFDEWKEKVEILRAVLSRIDSGEPDRWARAFLEDGAGYLRETGDRRRPYCWLLTLPQLLALWRCFLKSEGWKLSRLCSLLIDARGQPIDPKKVKANPQKDLPAEALDAMKQAGFLYTP